MASNFTVTGEIERLEAEGVSLPHFVNEEFEAYRKCDRLEYGFLRVKCDACRNEKLVAFSCKRRGFCPGCGGSALNLDPHLHMPFVDGAYAFDDAPPRLS